MSICLTVLYEHYFNTFDDCPDRRYVLLTYSLVGVPDSELHKEGPRGNSGPGPKEYRQASWPELAYLEDLGR